MHCVQCDNGRMKVNWKQIGPNCRVFLLGPDVLEALAAKFHLIFFCTSILRLRKGNKKIIEFC